MRPKSRDLLLVCGHALFTLVLVLGGADSFLLRLLCGLPLVFVSPGYALVAALFPRRSLPPTDRALFAVGLSLCVTILGGFALHALPWGLQATGWAILLAAISLAASAVAIWRRSALAQGEASEQLHQSQQGSNIKGQTTLGLNGVQSLLLGVAGMLLLGSVVLARHEATLQPAADVIQLWMLPAAGQGVEAVQVGVTSVGIAEGTFRLQIVRDGYLIHEWPTLTIKAGEEWQEVVSLGGRQPGSGPFEAQLYRSDQPTEPFRRVAFWPQTPDQ